MRPWCGLPSVRVSTPSSRSTGPISPCTGCTVALGFGSFPLEGAALVGPRMRFVEGPGRLAPSGRAASEVPACRVREVRLVHAERARPHVALQSVGDRRMSLTDLLDRRLDPLGDGRARTLDGRRRPTIAAAEADRPSELLRERLDLCPSMPRASDVVA